MSNELKIADTPPQLENEPTDAHEVLREKLRRIANKAAKRAAERQQRYDGDHGIFTK